MSLTQLNQAAVYMCRIAFAVYFLAPLGQGDFAAARSRFFKLGVPLLVGGVVARTGDWLLFTYEWICRQVLYALDIFGVETAELAVQVLKLAANLLAIGFIVRYAWFAWRDGRIQ
ncbi:hypothetical protein Slin15195_G045470 [Septoria linicola]|uniref:Uncharacterized protein n=1 Tax=Septoria linicola TaxID=215465 RepID=A0A9Q9EJD9_9PEZI|nr:hypothetical protein Slin14017_G048990 [Septoria linicola]USW51228.1 hypothetical protein Slin15195_G045470 [Septoria linicola]